MFVSFPILQAKVLNWLNRPIEDEEIRQAVFKMQLWKAPGPDGFPAGFYQKAWDIVHLNVCSFGKDVWRNLSLLQEVNKTDICLIPKVPSP